MHFQQIINLLQNISHKSQLAIFPWQVQVARQLLNLPRPSTESLSRHSQSRHWAASSRQFIHRSATSQLFKQSPGFSGSNLLVCRRAWPRFRGIGSGLKSAGSWRALPRRLRRRFLERRRRWKWFLSWWELFLQWDKWGSMRSPGHTFRDFRVLYVAQKYPLGDLQAHKLRNVRPGYAISENIQR